MKMTLSEVLIRRENLATLSGKVLPSKLSYAIAKNLMKLQTEVEIIEKGRISILERYAKKDEEGNPVIKDSSYELGENMAKFNEEYQEYIQTETDVEIMTVSSDILDKLDEPRYDAFTGAQMIAIDFMIE